MARRPPKDKRSHREGTIWQGEEARLAWISAYRNQMLNMLLTRFRWINLPQGCDERFLELTLLTNGVATICQPKKFTEKGSPVFFSTQAVMDGNLNVYQNPTKWRSYGINGWDFEVGHRNGVLVFDNHLRVSNLPQIRLLATELADIKLTKQVNRAHVRNPMIIAGPQTKRRDIVNMFSAWISGSPAVLGVDDMDVVKTDVMFPKIDFLGSELQQDWLNVWEEFYRLAGISNLPFKAERQIRDEVRSQLDPTQLTALDPLGCRREACERLNRMFDGIIEPVSVVWNEDFQSENFNFMANLKERITAEQEGGGEIGAM